MELKVMSEKVSRILDTVTLTFGLLISKTMDFLLKTSNNYLKIENSSYWAETVFVFKVNTVTFNYWPLVSKWNGTQVIEWKQDTETVSFDLLHTKSISVSFNYSIPSMTY